MKLRFNGKTYYQFNADIYIDNYTFLGKNFLNILSLIIDMSAPNR